MTQKAVFQANRTGGITNSCVFAFGLNIFLQGEADVTQADQTLSARGLNFAADDTPARFGVYMANRSQQGSAVFAEIWSRPAGYEFTQQQGDTLQATGSVFTAGDFGWLWELPSLDADGELPAEGTLSVTQDANTIFARGMVSDISAVGGANVQQDNQTMQATGTVTDAEVPDEPDDDGEVWERVTSATTTWTRV